MSFEEAATLPLCSLTAAQVGLPLPCPIDTFLDKISQALFIRLGVNAPFPNPAAVDNLKTTESPAILVYSASTSVGRFAVELARIARTPEGKPYRVFATASLKNHAKLLERGVEAVFDYRSPTWPEDVRKASGGISSALDCISEDDSTAKISQTFVESGGTIAVLRKSAWHAEGIKDNATPIYSAVWSGLGHEVVYNGMSVLEPFLFLEILTRRIGGTIPASPSWRALTVEFFKFLSSASPTDRSRFPIEPIPTRLMPGGLERIVPDAIALLGSGKVVDRIHVGNEPWLKPISGEKLVYHVDVVSMS